MQSQIKPEFQPSESQLQVRQPAAPPLGMPQLLLGTIVALSTIVGDAVLCSVQAASLTNWSFDPTVNQLEITVKDGTTPRYFLMAQPARIVVDLPDTAIGNVSAQKTYAGPVRQIRVSQFEPGLTRIVMEISPGVSLAPGQVELQKVGDRTAQAGNSRWVVRPLVSKSLSANVATAVNPSAVKPLQPVASIAPTKPTTVAPSASVPIGNDPIRQPATIGSNLPSPPPAQSANPSAITNTAADAKNDANDSKPAGSMSAAPTAPVALAPALPAAPIDKNSTRQQPAAIGSNLPSPPPAESADPSATTNTAADAKNDANDSKPAGSMSAAPAAPIALAPALPAAPTQNAAKRTPASLNPLDPNMGIDTSGGVAIAVPSPVANPSTPVAPPPATPSIVSPLAAALPATPKPVANVPTKPAAPTPRSTTSMASRIQPANTARPLTTAKPAPTATSDTAANIPLSLAARPSADVPSVSVPPLDRRQSDRIPTNQSVRPAPSSNLIAPPSPTTTAPEIVSAVPAIAPNQPSISVPPPIQVGTPALGSSNSRPRIEAAPYTPSLSAAPSAVSVPPLQSSPPLQQTVAPSTPLPPEAGASYDADTIRQAPTTPPGVTAYDANTVRQPPSANLAPPLELAPLQAPAMPALASPTYDASTVRQAPTKPAPTPIVNFGQPLPVTSSAARVSGQPLALVNQSPGVRQALNPTAPNVLLPAGTPLNLRYPGKSALSLRTDSPQQEVLVLQADLRDVSGNVLAPAGSLVTGRFETTTAGSQFVTQAIALTGRTLPLMAQSEALNGSRQVAGTDLARNSGIGVLAGGVLGAISGSTGLGALGGAAAGAAATLITAPKPAMIQPDQLIQVRLTQDLSL
ncbi:AMIN domain-containing protein [Leptolyngbya sp. FACHB-321]|uniref:AMIN domain-containing protein n=1 Tax=Leptolyngbya sp. FACHB-321 TaxID=2692807 RepID=UPI0016876835|nr:AMIN domain-containing protein [Leptolyngbya sp. FACHB-321]MBD2036334.1 AMIN domain-containing protein [Leptolyngbya sp. FACHB-321]